MVAVEKLNADAVTIYYKSRSGVGEQFLNRKRRIPALTFDSGPPMEFKAQGEAFKLGL